MNGTHLPAGRASQGGPGHGEMGPGPGHGGGGGGRRGGRQHPYMSQYHQQVNHQMYPGYMNPYAPPYGYPPMAPHYPGNGAMPNAYMQYAPYAASPQTIQPFVPMMRGGMVPPQQPHQSPPHQQLQPQHQQQAYSRASAPSPVIVTTPSQPPQSQPRHQSPVIVSTPSHPAPAPSRVEAAPIPTSVPNPLPAPVLPPTPSSTHSSQVAPTPLSPVSSRGPESAAVAEARSEQKPFEPFRAPLPWLSRPDVPFPTRSPKSKRKRRVLVNSEPVMPRDRFAYPPDDSVESSEVETPSHGGEFPATEASTPKTGAVAQQTPDQTPRADTPSTQEQPSEGTTSTSPTTPSSVQQATSSVAATPTQAKAAKPLLRSAVPALPIIPAVPKASVKEAKPATASADKIQTQDSLPLDQAAQDSDKTASSVTLAAEEAQEESKPAAAPAPSGPKLWANLFSKPAGSSAVTSSAGARPGVPTSEGQAGSGAGTVAGFAKSNANSMAEALWAYRVDGVEKIPFLEPRGLINTGNMCYMNSVLQVLVFCIPFYDFLDQARKKAVHSFKSETPLIDAMIMFIREFNVIDSADSVEQLRRRLKSEELEQYGDAFIPEFVYDAIKQISRFSSMRRGHQQDAEEFLEFLLECLNEECTQVMRETRGYSSETASAAGSAQPTRTPSVSSDAPESANGWLEVGHRQRAAVTRSSGHSSASPINKIFGGQLRSELRVAGLKDSVTLEPFQSLQLDIDSPEVRNIMDALRGLTKPETLHGDFRSPLGKDTAVKQVFIESLPPVLILHLKRFQFDAQGYDTVKIWKKVGYPLELEIPREVFSRQRRNRAIAEGVPKYRLTAVVYHHGRHASGGHYTVDALRQDGREWVRLDDTVIRRIRSEDVAEGGAEEEVSKSSQDSGRREGSGPVTAVGSANRFAGMGDEDTGDAESEWKQVTPLSGGGKKWSTVVNASPQSAAPKGKQIKENVKDNKVAYLLFYQRI